MATLAPVTRLADSEQRKVTPRLLPRALPCARCRLGPAAALLQQVGNRSSGCAAASANPPSTPSVRIKPGSTQFASTPSGAYVRDRLRVMFSSAAFEAASAGQRARERGPYMTRRSRSGPNGGRASMAALVSCAARQQRRSGDTNAPNRHRLVDESARCRCRRLCC